MSLVAAVISYICFTGKMDDTHRSSFNYREYDIRIEDKYTESLKGRPQGIKPVESKNSKMEKARLVLP